MRSRPTPAATSSAGRDDRGWGVIVLMLVGVMWRRRQEEASARVMEEMRKRQRVAAYEGAFRDMVQSRLGEFLCGVAADRSIAAVMDPSTGRIASFAIAWTGVKEDSGAQSVKRSTVTVSLDHLHGVRLHVTMEQGITKKSASQSRR